MPFVEDRLMLQRILPDVADSEIALKLKQVPLKHSFFRCEQVLQEIINQQDAINKANAQFQQQVEDDFQCIKHVLKNFPEDLIRDTLYALGPITERKHAAVRVLLLQKKSEVDTRKRKHLEENQIVKIKNLKINEKKDMKNLDEGNLPTLNLNSKPATITSGVISLDDSNPYNVDREQEILQGVKRKINMNNAASDITKQRLINVDEYNLPNTKSRNSSSLKPATITSDCISLDDTLPHGDVHRDDEFARDQLLHGEVSGQPVNTTAIKEISEKLFLKIVELFPNACPYYIRTLCREKIYSSQSVDEVIDIILSNNQYPTRPAREQSPDPEVDQEEQIKMLEELLPDADPTYLRAMYFECAGKEKLGQFINEAMESKSYPTRKEFLRTQQISAQQKQYTTEFNIQKFIQLFKDPVAYFEDPTRRSTMIDMRDRSYVAMYMRNRYRRLSVKIIDLCIHQQGKKNILAIIQALDNEVKPENVLKVHRRLTEQTQTQIQNIPLLQELAYFYHKAEIVKFLEDEKIRNNLERQNAKELNLLQSCACCYDEEVMPKDVLKCSAGCRFCRDCVRKGTEITFADGKLEFVCLADCGGDFSLQTLQNALPSNVFSKIAQKKAVAEVKAAGMEDLETCPFCDFASIPAPDDRLFRCLNPDCMKESCRKCKEMSHIPLRCEEVEKDEAVRARTYIENKMTEALIRECWKCKNKFIKEEGCNKMTCSCGASMCYICRQPVKDYKHFNGQGGDRHDLCPLYTDNFVVNEANVIKAAKQAKMEIDPSKLTQDPTSDLMNHFGDKMKQYNGHRRRGGAAHRGMWRAFQAEALRAHRQLTVTLQVPNGVNPNWEERAFHARQFLGQVRERHLHPPHPNP